jgi:pimeloyl-ACP methyl ester carboxylesterase
VAAGDVRRHPARRLPRLRRGGPRHGPARPPAEAPTLVVAGQHDPATPPEANEYIKNHIPGAQFATLDAAHISNVEQPEAYAKTVLGFLRAGKQ